MYTYLERGISGQLSLTGAFQALNYDLPEEEVGMEPTGLAAKNEVAEVVEAVVWSTASFDYSFNSGSTFASWPANTPLPISMGHKSDAEFKTLRFRGGAVLNWHILGGGKSTT